MIDILGFNQREAIKLGLKNDDLLVLRWFIDMQMKNKMKKIYIPFINNMGYCYSYKEIYLDLPIIFDGDEIDNDYKLHKILSGPLGKIIKTKAVRDSKETDYMWIVSFVEEKEYAKLII